MQRTHLENQMKSLIGERELREYKNFALREDMLKMTVGIMLGNSFNKVIYGFSDYLLMPVLKFLMSKTGEGWREWDFVPVHGLDFEIGKLLGVFADFLLTSVLLYIFYIKFVGNMVRREDGPQTKECKYCLGKINPGAVKCPLCTGDLSVKTRRNRTKNPRTKNPRGK